MVDAIVHEIDGIPAYLAESVKLLADTTELRKAQAITIGAKIRMLKSLKMEDATRLKVIVSQRPDGILPATHGCRI